MHQIVAERNVSEAHKPSSFGDACEVVPSPLGFVSKDALRRFERRAGNLVLQRRLRIAEIIQGQGSVRVDALGEMLSVSAVTVRSDLAYLKAQGLVLRGAGHATALPDEKPLRPDPLPPAWSLLPLLQAARRQVANETTVLLGPGAILLRLLPLLVDAHGLALILCALDAVPLARSCLDAPLHLLCGEIGPDSRIGEPKASHGLVLHDVDLLLVEARGIRGRSLLLAPSDSEALLLAASGHARRVVVLVCERDATTAGGMPRLPRLPLSLANLVLLCRPPGSGARQALQQAGFAAGPATDPVPAFRRDDRHSRRNPSHAHAG